MALKDNIKFKSIQNEAETEFQNIMNDKELDIKAKRDKISNILKIDNTNEKIVFEYLKLQKEILSKSSDDILKNSLLQYEFCIDEKIFNEAFQNENLNKTSYLKRIMNLISLIKEYKNKKELEEKIELLEKIDSKKPDNFHNSIPINYDVNLELFFYSLYDILYKHILNLYKNNFFNQDDGLPDKAKNYIKELEIKKSKILFINKEEKNKNFEELEKKLKYIRCIYGTFNNSFNNMSTFVRKTNDKYMKRFKDNTIKNEKELLLFCDYIFFLSLYEFDDAGNEYANIWNDTFADITFNEKNQIAKSFSFNHFKFNLLDNNILTVENDLSGDEPYSIENIDDYSFISLVDYIFRVDHKPDLIELNRFLKIDKYNEKLYIRQIWNIWENFLIKVFSSTLVKSIFEQIFVNIDKEKKLSPYNFIDEDEIKFILNNTRYFIFKSDFHVITLGKNLIIYQNGDPYFIDQNPLISKLAYLSNNVQSNLHEIIVHLNIRFQFYLFKDTRYTSPKPEKPSDQAKDRDGKEAGEFVEELLFGALNKKFEIEQMIYILDINNYNKDCKTFREEFLKCGEKKGYNIYPELKEFLNQLGINTSKINFESKKRLCFIQRHKNENDNNKYVRHPLEGYDDIYYKINDNLL